LVLLRFDPLGTGGFLAKVQELPYAVTKLRESPKAKL